jgi:hypothetical protein
MLSKVVSAVSGVFGFFSCFLRKIQTQYVERSLITTSCIEAGILEPWPIAP